MARPRSTTPPQTPAERQAKCRALKRGESWYCPSIPHNLPKGCTNPNVGLRQVQQQAAALPGPATSQPALPAPPSTAIQKPIAAESTTLALAEANEPGERLHLSLPPAVAARLKSLLDRHDAGKLTASERAEAQGLIDIAEYFVVQRLRRRLAA